MFRVRRCSALGAHAIIVKLLPIYLPPQRLLLCHDGCEARSVALDPDKLHLHETRASSTRPIVRLNRSIVATRAPVFLSSSSSSAAHTLLRRGSSFTTIRPQRERRTAATEVGGIDICSSASLAGPALASTNRTCVCFPTTLLNNL